MPNPSTMEAPSLCRSVCSAARRALNSFPRNASGAAASATSTFVAVADSAADTPHTVASSLSSPSPEPCASALVF